MATYICNECGTERDGEPMVIIMIRADLSYGEVMVCHECESEEIISVDFLDN